MAVHVKEALADSKHMPMWMDRPGRPEVTAALNENIKADLAIVGAGYAGLWAAILAKEARADLDVVFAFYSIHEWPRVLCTGIYWTRDNTHPFCSPSLSGTFGHWGNGVSRFGIC
jgi:hypothetical protein